MSIHQWKLPNGDTTNEMAKETAIWKDASSSCKDLQNLNYNCSSKVILNSDLRVMSLQLLVPDWYFTVGKSRSPDGHTTCLGRQAGLFSLGSRNFGGSVI